MKKEFGGKTMKDFVNLLKLPPKILAGLAIASGLLLFLPDKIISKLYMDSLKSKYGFLIGVIFIVTISILTCYTLIVVGKAILHTYNNKRLIKYRKAFLKKLDYEDKILIREMMEQPGKTLELPVNHGTVIKLAYYNVITPTGSSHLVDPFDMRIIYFLQPWVIQEITANPDLLNINTEL